MYDDKYQKLRDYALKLLSYRPRSRQEIRGKLIQYSLKRSISSSLIEKLIDDLTDLRFIDDTGFAKWWIEQRQTFRPKGERALKIELKNKGIDKEIVEGIFAQEGVSKSRELENALTIAQKKFPLYKNLPAEKIKIRLSGVLARRGFTWEVIYQVIDELLKKSYNR